MNDNPDALDKHTQININNGQGCAQFISYEVNFNDVRWTRCSFGGGGNGSVPEPASLLLFGVAAGGLAAYRRRRGRA